MGYLGIAVAGAVCLALFVLVGHVVRQLGKRAPKRIVGTIVSIAALVTVLPAVVLALYSSLR